MLSSLYTQFVANLLFPLHEKLKHHDSVARLKRLQNSQWLSNSAIKTIQKNNLQQFIQDIYQHTPYYRQLMDERGLKPTDIDSVEALSRLPILTKSDIRDNFEQFKTDSQSNVKIMATGGSTGEPLKFGLGDDRISHDVAAKWRATQWWDVDIGDREIVLWGSPVELGSQDRVKQLRDLMIRSKLIPAFDISDTNAQQYIDAIADFRPKMLFGYPSTMALLAQYAIDNQIDVARLGVKVAFVTSERLYDEQREVIERAFSCPVANGYGGRDAGFLAHECPHGKLHLSEEDIVVEIVDDDGNRLANGETGNIVVTHTSTRSFPFVRYQTGDVGAISDEPCACGRGLSILSQLDGRSTDFIVTPDGRKMHGLSLIYILREVSNIDLYKIIQHSVDEIEIQIMPSENYNVTASEKLIVDGIKERMGQAVSVNLVYPNDIGREKSGKYRYVVSHVDSRLGNSG